MNDKQQEQNFPSSSIIKDMDNKFHQLLKETVHCVKTTCVCVWCLFIVNAKTMLNTRHMTDFTKLKSYTSRNWSYLFSERTAFFLKYIKINLKLCKY